VSIEWVDTMSEGLMKLRAAVAENIDEAVAEGAEVILLDSDERMPKESGHLAGTGKVNKARGGSHTVGITYDGPYARWIHEHLFFKHPHGGQAKYLETAMAVKGNEAINEAGRALWRRL
jgi:hypothetical protein